MINGGATRGNATGLSNSSTVMWGDDWGNEDIEEGEDLSKVSIPTSSHTSNRRR